MASHLIVLLLVPQSTTQVSRKSVHSSVFLPKHSSKAWLQLKSFPIYKLIRYQIPFDNQFLKNHSTDKTLNFYAYKNVVFSQFSKTPSRHRHPLP